MYEKIVKTLITFLFDSKLKEVEKLYQAHVGQECYLFGDGISLKWMDLEKFNNRPSILGGFLVYHNDVKKLQLPYVALIEPNWFWPIFPYGGFKKLNFKWHTVHWEYRKSVKEHSNSKFFINISNFPVTMFENAIYVSRWCRFLNKKNNPFIERKDAHFGTLKFQISMAIFMGFKKAYLVGHDYTHFPSRDLHFYEKGEGVITGDKNFCEEFIEYAKEHIQLVTVTLDSESRTMSHVKYKDLTGEEPRFKENVDIVPIEKLKSLEKWRGYKIF